MKVFLAISVFITIAVYELSACECGLEGSASRIFKGTKARANKYPWLANVQIKQGSVTFLSGFKQCGGSLIDEKTIITAAHCVLNGDKGLVKTSRVKVYLGGSSSGKSHSVASIWYDGTFDKKNLANDLAILTLEKPVQFSPSIAPICIPTSDGTLEDLTTAGWGITSAKGDGGDDLLETKLDWVPKHQCDDNMAAYFKRVHNIGRGQAPTVSLTHICAINKETGGTTCAGDSGGPLMSKGKNGLYYLVGVTSGSYGDCGKSVDIAGLYTRVSSYAEPIKEHSSNACFKRL